MCVANAQLANQNAKTDFNDDAMYGAIQAFLKVKYPNDPVLTKCMSDHFRNNKIADNFSTMDFIGDHAWIQDSIEPYEQVARIKCNVAIFSSSPFGVIILVAFLLVVILLLCCLIKKIWC